MLKPSARPGHRHALKRTEITEKGSEVRPLFGKFFFFWPTLQGLVGDKAFATWPPHLPHINHHSSGEPSCTTSSPEQAAQLQGPHSRFRSLPSRYFSGDEFRETAAEFERVHSPLKWRNRGYSACRIQAQQIAEREVRIPPSLPNPITASVVEVRQFSDRI
ncbi:uncharacterized protein LOC129739764 [Uranotaenia lowii]|uniref:uncharacterized protein LOC129739764 n=1 Tax=Uranotaenia lowii TaxID=190385 RepID=UPI0024799C12|nr:uncharacterized protein LOC129739764 [Uranotaenia lowii]